VVVGRWVLAAVTVAAVVVPAGCAAGHDPADVGGDSSRGSASPPAEPGTPSDGPGGTGAGDSRPPRAAAICAPYAEVVAAVESLDAGADRDEVVAELAPVVRGWAEDLAGTGRPRGMAAPAWAGVQLLAERVLALPRRPTYAELEAVAADLSAREGRQLTAASSWLVRACARR